MKLVEREGKVKLSEGAAPTQFRINSTRKAFEILSSGLYSDKIAAVIRELSCNAADSHTAANNPNPFIVHLPNRMEPEFYVKDEGTGLSEDEVMGLYTTYFDSSRMYSNDFTGCLGLGSKSPFSYTEQFTITSWNGGTKSIYNCFLDAERIPSVIKMHGEACDKHTGLEVKMPVKITDFEEFRTKAETILSRFAVRPIVKGTSVFNWNKIEYLHKTDKFGVYKQASNYYNVSHSKVVMGNVAYALASNELSGLTANETNIINHGVDLFLPIGAVDVAANREKLQYTPATVKTLKAFITDIANEVAKVAEDNVKAAKTHWEANERYALFRNTILGSFLGDNVKWNGKKVYSQFYLSDFKNHPEKCTMVRVSTDRPYRSDEHNAYVHCDRPVFINDMTRGAYPAVSTWLAANNKQIAYLINKTPTVETHPPKPDNRLDIDESGIYSNSILASTLPKPEKKADGTPIAPKRKYERLMQLDRSHTNWGDDAKGWPGVKTDIKQGGVWVETFRFKAQNVHPCGGESMCPTLLNQLLNDVKEISGKDVVVFGMREADIVKWDIKNKSEWTHIKDHLTAIIKALPELHKKAILAQSFFKLYDRDRFKPLYKETFAKGSLFGAYIEKVEQSQKYSTDAKVLKYRDIAIGLKPDAFTEAELQTLTTEYKDLLKKYPLLHCISWTDATSATNKKHFLEYIAICDKTK